jgi:hypothetical protein
MSAAISMTAILILGGLTYSLVVSYLAYRESGEKWMLFFPHWLDSNSGVSKNIRRHGFVAFAILLLGVVMLLVP